MPVESPTMIADGDGDGGEVDAPCQFRVNLRVNSANILRNRRLLAISCGKLWIFVEFCLEVKPGGRALQSTIVRGKKLCVFVLHV